jgi:hypothetical protein
MLDQQLWDECADWIAAQLEEENVLIDPSLVALIIEIEHDEHGGDHAASLEVACSIEAALSARGIAGVPDAIDARLIYTVLQWEDEFLGLAGRPRPAR